jgi:hypothetical protein
MRIGQRGFVSEANWPKFDQFTPDLRSNELEDMIKQTLQDTQEIITTTKITARKIHYYAAAKWKWRVYLEALTRASSRPETLDGLIREMLAAKPPAPKDLSKFASKIIKLAKTMPDELRVRRLACGVVDEQKAISDARNFLGKELKAEVEVHGEDDESLYDPKRRGQFAEPYRPAIFIE